MECIGRNYTYIYDVLNREGKNCSNDKLVKKKNFFQNSTIIFRDILFLPNDAQSPKKEKKSMKLMRVECEEKDKWGKREGEGMGWEGKGRERGERMKGWGKQRVHSRRTRNLIFYIWWVLWRRKYIRLFTDRWKQMQMLLQKKMLQRKMGKKDRTHVSNIFGIQSTVRVLQVW